MAWTALTATPTLTPTPAVAMVTFRSPCAACVCVGTVYLGHTEVTPVTVTTRLETATKTPAARDTTAAAVD